MANWLNTTFAGLDGAMFSAMNSISCKFLTFLCNFITFFGEKGWICIATGLIMMLFRKTRRVGFSVLLAVAVGALFTNITIKPSVARPRPYLNPEYAGFWKEVGASVESEFSFPSGHTTSVMAGAVAIFCAYNKKWSFIPLVFALLMGFTRIYLIVHYTTDVIGGLIVGTVAGVIAFYLAKLTFNILEKHKCKKLIGFVCDFDVKDIFKKIKGEKE